MSSFTVKPIFLAGIVLPSLLLTNFALAMNSGARAQLDSKISQHRGQARGAMVATVSREYIEDAVGKVGGNANVDFGVSGGVIIGTGADGLVATSNQSNGGPIVVAAPLMPRTSITVAGRMGANASPKITATAVIVDSQGKILLHASTTDRAIQGKIGVPLRLTPGKYVLEFSGSAMIFDLKEMENKIIPLREISIPAADGKVKFAAYREQCSAPELRKTATAIVGFDYLSNTVDAMLQDVALERAKNPTWDCSFSNPELPEALRDQKVLATGTDGQFFSVLPGVYQIVWTIDGQNDYTRNIVVE